MLTQTALMEAETWALPLDLSPLDRLHENCLGHLGKRLILISVSFPLPLAQISLSVGDALFSNTRSDTLPTWASLYSYAFFFLGNKDITITPFCSLLSWQTCKQPSLISSKQITVCRCTRCSGVGDEYSASCLFVLWFIHTWDLPRASTGNCCAGLVFFLLAKYNTTLVFKLSYCGNRCRLSMVKSLANYMKCKVLLTTTVTWNNTM